MITDADLLFCEAQDCGQSASTFVSTNVYDRGPFATGNAGVASMGSGRPLYFYWLCEETFASSGGATIKVELVSDALVGGHDANSIRHYNSGLMDASTGGTPIAAGNFAFAPLPSKSIDGQGEWQRYLAVLFTVATATTTAGTITAGIVEDPSIIINHASALNFL